MIIKLLFAVMVLSLFALLGVAVAVFVRVWTHLKGRNLPGPEPSTPEAPTEQH